jgi:hypothetical protein
METSCLPGPAACFVTGLPPRPRHATALAGLLGAPPGMPLAQALVGRLSDRTAGAMAILMPHLLCGEESAALAFTGFRHAAEAGHVRRLWAGIAADERLHDFMLGQLVRALDADRAPDSDKARRRARLFFLHLKSAHAPTHFARISALDCFVSRVLAALQGRRSLLRGHAPLMRLLGRIRADESRHVRATRGYLLDAGAPQAMLREERARVAAQFLDFLSPYFGAFDLLQVDPRALAHSLI